MEGYKIFSLLASSLSKCVSTLISFKEDMLYSDLIKSAQQRPVDSSHSRDPRLIY